MFALRSSIVLTFSIAAYPVWKCCRNVSLSAFLLIYRDMKLFRLIFRKYHAIRDPVQYVKSWSCQQWYAPTKAIDSEGLYNVYVKKKDNN